MEKWKTLIIKKFSRGLQYSLDDREYETDSYSAISGLNTIDPNALLRNHLDKGANVATYPTDNEAFSPIFFDFGDYLYYLNSRNLFRIGIDGTSTLIAGMKTYIDADANFSTGVVTSCRVFNNSIYVSFSLGTVILKMTIADDLSIAYASVGNFAQNSLEVAHNRLYCLGKLANNNIYYTLDGTTWTTVAAPEQTSSAKLQTHPNNADITYNTHAYNGNSFYDHFLITAFTGIIPDIANGKLKPQSILTRLNDSYGVYQAGKFKILQGLTNAIFKLYASESTTKYPIIRSVCRYRNKLLVALCISTSQKSITGTITSYLYIVDPINDTCDYVSEDYFDITSPPPIVINNPNSNQFQIIYLWTDVNKRIILNFRSINRLYGTTFGTDGSISLSPLSFGSPHIPTIIKSVAVSGVFPGSPTLKVQAIIDGISTTDLCSATVINQETIKLTPVDLLPERTRYQLKFLFASLSATSPTRIDSITILYKKKGT